MPPEIVEKKRKELKGEWVEASLRCVCVCVCVHTCDNVTVCMCVFKHECRDKRSVCYYHCDCYYHRYRYRYRYAPRSDMGDLNTMHEATMITTLLRVLATLWVTGPDKRKK
jgi:hypothetical protein